MHKVLISYHHYNDQDYKDALVKMACQHEVFIDRSVDTEDIDDSLPDERIREIIRDEYLRDSTVTIVLGGEDTKRRKHVDWEIYSSMFGCGNSEVQARNCTRCDQLRVPPERSLGLSRAGFSFQHKQLGIGRDGANCGLR